MSLLDALDVDFLKEVFGQSLCENELGFSSEGYLTPCFCSTYLFSPAVIMVTIWALSEISGLATNHHPANSTSGKIKFMLTCLYAVMIVLHGPNILNAVGVVVSYTTLFPMFVLSYFDLKGVRISTKSLEAYFFVAAVYSGYLFVQFIGTNNYSPALNSAVYVCLVSSLAGAAFNIISAFDAAVETKQKKE